MGKIISGGLKGSKPISRSNEQPIEEQTQQAKQPNWLERNVGGAVEGFLEGLAHLSKTLKVDPTKYATGAAKQIFEQIPSQTAAEQLPELFRSYMGQPQGYGPAQNIGESALRFGLTEAPFIAASGGLSSVPAFARSLAGSLGGLGGSYLGQQAGSLLGEYTGEPEKAELLGGLLGGIGGSTVGRALVDTPSKFLPKKIYDKNVKEFETDKQNRLAKLEEEYVPKIEELRKSTTKEKLNINKEKSAFEQSKKDSLNKLQKQHHKNLKQVEQQNKSDLDKLYKDHNERLKAILNDRNDQIKQQKVDLENRNKLIEELKGKAEPLYEKAKQISEKIIEPADNLVNNLDTISKNIGRGVETGERSKINGLIKDIQKDIETGKYNPEKGKIALDSVKQAQKNINLKLSEKNQFGSEIKRTLLGSKYKEISKALNKFIEEVGEKYPEHAQAYKPAEQTAATYKELQRTKNEFKREQIAEKREINENYRHQISEANKEFQETKRNLDNKQNIKDLNRDFKEASEKIKSEKFPKEKEILSSEKVKEITQEYKTTTAEYKKIREDIGKETYDKLIKSDIQQEKWVQVANKIADKVDKYGLSGLGYYIAHLTLGGKIAPILAGLGTKLAQEIKLSNKTFKEHPELFKEYSNIFKEGLIKDTTKLINRLNEIAPKVEAAAKEESEQSISMGRIIKGGLKK